MLQVIDINASNNCESLCRGSIGESRGWRLNARSHGGKAHHPRGWGSLYMYVDLMRIYTNY